MLKKYTDKENNFYEVFDSDTGLYVRTGELDDGRDTGVDPFKRDFPSLIDVGVMGHCAHGMSGYCKKSGTQCYQNGSSVTRENMSLENFCKIVDQCKGKVFQFALGGRGDVDQHENCEDLLAYSRKNEIVPNFTTSGYGLNHRIVDMLKEYVGAVAVSWYRSEYTQRAINMMISAGLKTNVHYILGKNSIEEAISRLVDDTFPEGINKGDFMKITVDFITNSSSSNYVIAYKALPSIDQQTMERYPFISKYYNLVEQMLFADGRWNESETCVAAKLEDIDSAFVRFFGWDDEETINDVLAQSDWLNDLYERCKRHEIGGT